MEGLTCASVPLLLLLLLQISGVSGAYCYNSNYNQVYCSYGCCTSYSSDPCCSYSSYYSSIYGTASTVLSIGTIIGIVFGALVGLAVIVGIIIAIVSCCCKTTRVVNPQPVTYTGHTMHVFQTNTSGAGPSSGNLPGQPQPYYGYGQGPQGLPPYSQKGTGPHPPPYIPQGQPPPAYNYSNPAYPPPSTVSSAPPISTASQAPPPTPSPFAAAVNSAGN